MWSAFIRYLSPQISPRSDGFTTKFYLKAVCSSVAQWCPTPCNPMDAALQASLSLTISQSLPKFMSLALVMPSSLLILWCPLLLLPSIFPNIRDFSNESSVCIRWPRYGSFSFNISPSNEYPGLISLKIDSFDLLADQGTLRSLLQHHSLTASIPYCIFDSCCKPTRIYCIAQGTPLSTL